MRTLGTRAHSLLVVAAAAGLAASLRRPWYGEGPSEPIAGPDAELTERIAAGTDALVRVLGEGDGTSAWDAFARVDLVLAGLAGAIALLVVLGLAPPLAQTCRGLARLGALAAVGVVAWRLVDAPAAVGAEPRIGLVLALGCAVVALVSASYLVAAPERRRAAVAAYTPPAAPAYDASASYGPPQF